MLFSLQLTNFTIHLQLVLKLDKYNQKPPRTKKPSLDAIVTCIKADKDAPSGLIFDIRKELQNINAFTIAYAVRDNGNNQ